MEKGNWKLQERDRNNAGKKNSVARFSDEV